MKRPEWLDPDFFVPVICFVTMASIALAAILSACVLLGSNVWSSIDCEWRPESRRCTLLNDRGDL